MKRFSRENRLMLPAGTSADAVPLWHLLLWVRRVSVTGKGMAKLDWAASEERIEPRRVKARLPAAQARRHRHTHPRLFGIRRLARPEDVALYPLELVTVAPATILGVVRGVEVVCGRRIVIAVEGDGPRHLLAIDVPLDLLVVVAERPVAQLVEVRGVEVVPRRRVPIAVERDGPRNVRAPDVALGPFERVALRSLPQFRVEGGV